VIGLIEASRYGHTVQQAAAALLAERCAQPNATLASLIALLEDALFADLADAIGVLVAAIENRASLSTDVLQLLDALPPLVNVYRYGNVRETDVSLVAEILAALVPRLLVGIPGASSNIDDDAAQTLWRKLVEADRSLAMLARPSFTEDWRITLQRLAESDTVHPLIAGYANRLLYDASAIQFERLSQAFSLSLSPGNTPTHAAAWIEGLLSGSGAVLIHDDRLRSLVDRWIRDVSDEHFLQVLPLVRRTFAQFPAPERRQIGESLQFKESKQHSSAATDFDVAAASAVLPLLKKIWNLDR
jgi:Family of unknown function (DUF5682)